MLVAMYKHLFSISVKNHIDATKVRILFEKKTINEKK